MPGKIKVKVLAGRNLPVMDRASDTTDAFVEIKFGGVTHKTDVCRKSLNPHWSSTEWYRFEVDESELQDEPLQLRLMDHDTYSANDAIGKVVISLAPLLAREANNAKGTTGPPGGAVLSGWIPVFDTMHGIRGELNVIVKVELFSDFNKYKTSSCGVQFFHCPMIPPGYRATSIHGFVEELVVNDDPEYQWIDKIRTPRASNEARQVAFIKLSNQVQRLVGLKAAELGANAVVGYQQEFDLEGEAGVVARAIGTAVSITALPTPCQPVNTILCTQQQLKQCLDILVTDDDSITDLSQYYQTHREELQKMIQILNPKGLSLIDTQENDDDDDKVEIIRQSSLNSYAGSASLYQDNYASRNSLRHLSEDQTDLNRLLNRNDDDTDSSGPIQKIKKLKTNFFTKRFTKRKGDKKSNNKQDDTVSIKSNSSDTSRISFYDIKSELSKFKRLKKPKFRKSDNSDDEGEGMASILARSVIHARTSLQAIAETQDSQAENSPCSTLRRVSESSPNFNSDEDKVSKSEQKDKEVEDKLVPEIQFSSLKNISTDDTREARVRRISESCPTSPVSGRTDNLLKLPGETGYFGSVSSALSGESSIYSSSDDEGESSDLRTDTDEAFETTASVVKTVIRQEADPAFIDQMDRKLTVLMNTPPKLDQSLIENYEKRVSRSPEVTEKETNKPVESETSEFECKIDKAGDIAKLETPVSFGSTEASGEKCVPKPNSHYIKLHNPFAHKKTSASISCPSSPVEKHSKQNFVYRSSKRIKDKLAKISNSNMIKSISHISLFPKKKEQTLSQPGSSSDVPSCPSKYPSETVLGSHFLSYSDLLGLDKDRMQASKLCKSDEIGRSKFSMYIGSEPVSRCSLSGPSHPHSRDEHDHKRERHSLKPAGLIKTAMETMLIDKVEALLIPTSPDPVVNTKFFDDVSEKLEEHKNSGATMRQLQSTTASTTPRIVAVTPKRLSQDLTAEIDKLIEKKFEKEHKGFEPKDYPQVILPKLERKRTISLHEELNDETEKHKKKEARGSFSTLLDKVHFHPHFFHHKKDDSSHDIKSGGLIQAAMQTILIDRAQSMIPDTPEPIPVHTEPDFGEIGKHKHYYEKEHNHGDKDSKGLVHSALQTMLIDNVQSVLPDVEEPIPINTESDFGEEHHTSNVKDKDSSGLIHTALQTMLIDNVQSVLSDSSEPVPIRIEANSSDTKSPISHENEKESTGLVHSALQTMLIDNVQSILPNTDKPIPIRFDPNTDDTKSQKSHESDKKSTGLVHSALQTMLIDNVQSVLSDSSEPIPIRIETNLGDTKSQISQGNEKESTGLVHSALQTMLIDNVQSILPNTDKPIPIRFNPNTDDTKSQKSYGSDKESTGLVHSALQTMLIDNVQSVLSDSSEPIPIRIETNLGDTKSQISQENEKESTGLVHSALQTMLIDNVQSILPNTDKPIPIRFNPNTDDTKSQKSYGSDKVSTGLVHSALQTMLIDNVQTVLPDSSESVPVKHNSDIGKTETQKSHKSDKLPIGLVQTALQTMLIENVHSILPDTSKAVPIHLDSDKENTKSSDIKPIRLIGTAVETMLSDKAQAGINPNEIPVVEQNIEHKVHSDKDKTNFNAAMETILIDRMQTMFPKGSDTNLNKEIAVAPILDEGIKLKSTELVKNAMEKIEKAQSSVRSTENSLEVTVGDSKLYKSASDPFGPATKPTASDNVQTKVDNAPVAQKSNVVQSKPNEDSTILKSWSEDSKEELSDTKEDETRKPKKQNPSFEERKTHLTRQDSIHSVTSTKMSKEHVITSGLETIPSVDNDDRIEGTITNVSKPSDSDGVNQASVCGNSHAACRVDREPRDRDKDRSEKDSPRHARHESYGGKEPGGEKAHNSSLNASSTPMGIHRRSSDSDLSITPKGGSLNTSASNVGSGGGAILRPSMNSNNIDMLEYPFLTMTEYPPGFIVHIGGAVCARSVKLVDGGGESAARAAWWAELRTELRAHARALRCNAVIAYRDTAHICEDVCVLSASGTAVVINLDCDYSADIDLPATVNGTKTPEENDIDTCSIAHVPYSPGAGPYRAELSTCGVCRRARVPAVLLAACAKPNRLNAYPKAVTLTAVAARIRRAQPSSEPGARDISDQLPFLEYELHKLLLAKLRMQGANALFSLQTQIAIGERCVMALASGTAVKLTALPPPTPPRIKASEKEKDALEMQKALWDTFTANKAINGYDVPMLTENPTNGVLPEVEREVPTLDLCADKDACVLELDEAEDVETARALAKRRVNMQAYTNSLTQASDAQPLAFTQVSRARLVLSSGSGCGTGAARATARALDAAAYKLRRLAPTALHANFQLDLPEDEIQLVISGTAIPLADPLKPETSESRSRSQSHSQTSSQNNSQSSNTDDDIFQLDEEQKAVAQEIVEEKSTLNGQVGSAVTLSTLSSVGRGRCVRRMCALRLLFVRETTAVRELGGLSGFLHTFTCEVLAILRAYTAALGGNALTSFYITQLMLQDNAHKNQGQCLLSVGGDVVHVSY